LNGKVAVPGLENRDYWPWEEKGVENRIGMKRIGGGRNCVRTDGEEEKGKKDIRRGERREDKERI
jgi:hypothetical protein